ncbi:hypothetical protein E6O75_ATG11429 [Venturia nashicola]|uniref:Uncharacterized protein n=1 Tax=Venturia nashicola TaxID=86259 RepID=A0A4Z1P1P1_9PEZI|nr:hypothetical protein E6O75_ATG11429 [Venturia nashicola]
MRAKKAWYMEMSAPMTKAKKIPRLKRNPPLPIRSKSRPHVRGQGIIETDYFEAGKGREGKEKERRRGKPPNRAPVEPPVQQPQQPGSVLDPTLAIRSRNPADAATPTPTPAVPPPRSLLHPVNGGARRSGSHPNVPHPDDRHVSHSFALKALNQRTLDQFKINMDNVIANCGCSVAWGFRIVTPRYYRNRLPHVC